MLRATKDRDLWRDTIDQLLKSHGIQKKKHFTQKYKLETNKILTLWISGMKYFHYSHYLYSPLLLSSQRFERCRLQSSSGVCQSFNIQGTSKWTLYLSYGVDCSHSVVHISFCSLLFSYCSPCFLSVYVSTTRLPFWTHNYATKFTNEC